MNVTDFYGKLRFKNFKRAVQILSGAVHSVILLPCEVASPPPENGIDFQGHRHTGAVWNDACRVVPWWASRRHSSIVNIATRRARQLARTRHVLPHGYAAHDTPVAASRCDRHAATRRPAGFERIFTCAPPIDTPRKGPHPRDPVLP